MIKAGGGNIHIRAYFTLEIKVLVHNVCKCTTMHLIMRVQYINTHLLITTKHNYKRLHFLLNEALPGCEPIGEGWVGVFLLTE